MVLQGHFILDSPSDAMDSPGGSQENGIRVPEEEAAAEDGEPKMTEGTEGHFPNGRSFETMRGEAFARAASSGDALVYYAEGLTQDTFKICKEFLRPFKKCLRKLNLPKDFPKEKRLSCTRKNLLILGDHINKFLQDYCEKWELKHWKKMLWRFVSLFSSLDEKQLCKLYQYGKTGQTAKFLKAYGDLEGSSQVAVPENGRLMRLRDTWGLRGATERPEDLGPHSLPPNDEKPTRSSPKERLEKASSRTRKKANVDMPHEDPTASPSVLCSEGAALFSVSEEALLTSDM
ncbi:CHD1 helical C-terminal domain containing protein 1 isoform X2 [Anolis carolinensis]|uniref:CHD1 helical C-terminal domain containing protein 1 isoform X2 n=1 Tax=Anolis carolinensis TaxID=28377 RepID=UPI002F2B745B